MNTHQTSKTQPDRGSTRAGPRTVLTFIRYNAKQVFANKFIYFLFASIMLFLLII